MKTFAYLASILLLSSSACKSNLQESKKFQTTQLSVGVEDSNAAFKLTDDMKYVTKAELTCDGENFGVMEFNKDTQSVELFSEILDCELKLMEFILDGYTYKINELYSPGVYEFDYRDGDNRLKDRRLVRAIQGVGYGQDANCQDDCDFKEYSVTFPYSVLNIEQEILEIDIMYNQVDVALLEEPAPSCDSINARLVHGQDRYQLPSLTVELKNCHNTIDTHDLEFGIAKADLASNGSLASPLFIDDAQDLIKDFPVSAEKDGYDYTFTLSFHQIKDLWANPVSTIDALKTDFAVAIKNKHGISALVYLIDNKCKVRNHH